MSYAVGPIMQGVGQISGDVMQGIEMGQANDRLGQALGVIQNLGAPQLPQGDYRGVDYAGDYSPYGYNTPEQADATTISTDPATRNIQMQALQQLISQGNGAADATQAAAQFKALDAANQMANAREGAIRSDMESRGQGGSVLNAMMRAQAAQDGANRAQGGTLDAQSQAALQKLAALGQAGNMAGAVRGQDFQNAAANADILNRFNMFNVAANNAVNQANVGLQNEAQLRNLGVRQGLNTQNTGITNSNLDRRTQNALTMYGAQAAKAGATAGQLTGMANNALVQGGMYQNMGQRLGQYGTNLGSGMVARDNAQGGAGPAPQMPQQQPNYDMLMGDENEGGY